MKHFNNTPLKLLGIFITLFLLVSSSFLNAQESQVVYLSGKDADNTVKWDFFCTAGTQSKLWTEIPVPSCWELHGFGAYDYGRGNPLEKRLNEEGFYKYSFFVQNNWEGKSVDLVFDGVMTDCVVKLNGELVGDVHQGGFYQFKYTVDGLLKYGESNLLEVHVKKHSANQSVNRAERAADYWVFGGIFRPVYLEVNPKKHIKRFAIDAKANGEFDAEVYLSGSLKKGRVKVQIIDPIGEVKATFIKPIDNNDTKILAHGIVEKPALWSPEFPNLYLARFSLLDVKDKPIHIVEEKVGFRTVEVREQDGIYVNNVKIKLKGVNRHTFRPNYGRASTKEFSITDVNLIKDMNMNAVRMSHYPPEKHFLDVCDSLGLFVLNELAGWQGPPYDSVVGRILLEEMIVHDVNHPSIILWDNGNEGGWNTAYDKCFKELDIQKREVLHPWAVFEKFNTAHYITYNYLSLDNFSHRKIFLPTEFLHGLYDGGHGAGLEDYWRLMYNNPLCAGGFLWSFADECLFRSDISGLDCAGNQAPDGILGPYLDKEGSFYSIQKIWSPIHIEKRYITPEFNGVFNIQNRYHFTNLNQCKFSYEWIRVVDVNSKPSLTTLAKGDIKTEGLQPSQKGKLKVELVANWEEADILLIYGNDPHGRIINTWTWPVKSANQFFKEKAFKETPVGKVSIVENNETIILFNKNVNIEISKNDGTLIKVNNKKGELPLKGGPVVCTGSQELSNISIEETQNGYMLTATYEKEMREVKWEMLNNGLVTLDVKYHIPSEDAAIAGISFNYAEDKLDKVTYLGGGPYRVWKNRMEGPDFGLYEKKNNNADTGYRFEGYPKFKGYYPNLYWAKFESESKQSFVVYSNSDDIFLRLFNPENGSDPKYTELTHPLGDISFLHGIPAIGTKFKAPEKLGPQSQTYIYKPKRVDNGILTISLTFDFSGE